MSDKANGGPAFPTSYMQSTQDMLSEKQWKDVNARGEHFPAFVPAVTAGMSLRDYFAAKALYAIMSQPAVKAQSWKDVAHVAYSIADAMLAERAK